MLKPILVRSPGGRSGTSLMMEMLSSSKDIAFDRRHPYEVRMLSYFYRLSNVMFSDKFEGWSNDIVVRGDLNKVGRIPANTSLIEEPISFIEEHFHSSWEVFSRSAIEAHKKVFGVLPRFYAEKVPHDILPRASAILDCRVVYLTRDPRGEFSSILSFNQKRGTDLFGWKVTDTIDTFLTRFINLRKAYFRMISKLEDDSGNLIVSYEDMILNSEGTCKKIGVFLNSEISTAVVEKNLEKNSIHMTSDSPSSSINKWKSHLGSDVIERINNELMPYAKGYV